PSPKMCRDGVHDRHPVPTPARPRMTREPETTRPGHAGPCSSRVTPMTPSPVAAQVPRLVRVLINHRARLHHPARHRRRIIAAVTHGRPIHHRRWGHGGVDQSDHGAGDNGTSHPASTIPVAAAIVTAAVVATMAVVARL